MLREYLTENAKPRAACTTYIVVRRSKCSLAGCIHNTNFDCLGDDGPFDISYANCNSCIMVIIDLAYTLKLKKKIRNE